MSWYSIVKQLIKIAGPKEKIAQFGIKDPALRLFISKYESKIAWNGYSIDTVNAAGEEVQIEKKIRPTSAYVKANQTRTSEDDINEFLNTIRLPEVFAKADPKSPSNNYSRYFNIEKSYKEAKEEGVFNPDLDKAYELDQRVTNLIKTGMTPADIAKMNFITEAKLSEVDVENHAQKIKQSQAEEFDVPKGPDAQKVKKFRSVGEKFYLGIINNIKKQSFDGWINYFTGHPDYKNHPAFVYLLLNDILDSSDSKTNNPPPSVNPVVVAGIFHKIQSIKPIVNEQLNKEVLKLINQNATPEAVAEQLKIPLEQVNDIISQDALIKMSPLKTYKDDLAEFSIQSSKHQIKNDGQDQWLKLPSKAKTQPAANEKGEQLTAEQVFEENLKILDNFSIPNSWCTTLTWNARPYLTNGDFWMFIQNGKAEVGIRFHGDEIHEIAGDQKVTQGQNYVCPTRFWKEITTLIAKEGLEPKIKGYQAMDHWKKILQEKELNMSFFNPDGTPNLEEIEAFKKELIIKPELFSRVQNEKFERFPELVEELKGICKQGWFRKIQALHGHDALAMAENVAANAQNMPDFVLEDPAFLENVHGRLTAMYENNPENIKGVLDKVPNHWIVYPRGKEIFKQAVLKKYTNGMSWKANAYGASRKTKEQRKAIEIAKLELQRLEEAIGRYIPELNEDKEFQMELDVVKQASAEQAISEGFFSPDMPQDLVEKYFIDPEIVERLSTEFAERISKAHELPYKRQTEDTIFLDAFMNKEITSLVPTTFRKLNGFQNFMNKTKQKVLLLNIHKYPKFEDKYKDREIDGPIWRAYKEKMRNDRPIERQMIEGPDVIDPSLMQDPEFQVAEDDPKRIQQVASAVFKQPALYLNLEPAFLKDKPPIINAYIRSRVNVPIIKQFPLIREYRYLPTVVQDMQNVKDAYLAVVIQSLKLIKDRSHPNYADCDTIAPFAQGSPIVTQLCEKRMNANNVPNNPPNNPPKQAFRRWYRKLGTFA